MGARVSMMMVVIHCFDDGSRGWIRDVFRGHDTCVISVWYL